MTNYLDELITQKISVKKFSEVRVREFFLDLLHPFHQYLKSIHHSIYEMPKFKHYYLYEAIHTIETFQELKSWFLQFVQFYCTFIDDKKLPVRKEIDEVQKYLKQHYGERISVSDIAKHIGFTENYLSALYKKETGENITDYLNRLRMQRARELLKTTDLKIYEIIEEIGYSDANYFSRQFKRFEGLPPNDFRALMRGNSIK